MLLVQFPGSWLIRVRVHPGQVGGADQPGVLAELGHPDGGGGPVATGGQLGLEGLPGRADQQLPGLGHPAAEDEDPRVQDRGQVGHAVAEPGPDGPEGLEGDRVAGDGAHGHHGPGDGSRLPAAELQQEAGRGG